MPNERRNVWWRKRRRLTVLAAVLGAVLAACPELTGGRGDAMAQVQPAPGGGGIFVPKARESGATLDDSPVLSQKGATVVTRMGDRLTGVVTGITKDGVMRLTAPCLDREVGIFTSAISEARFPAGAVEAGKDQVALTNGDCLYGSIVGITATDVALDNSVLGLLKIGNRFITQITFQTAMLAHTDFRTGRADPLLISGGGWQVSNGALRNAAGQNSTAALALDQKGAITVVAEFARGARQCSLAVFSDTPNRADGGNGMNSLNVNYTPNSYSITVTTGYNTQAIASNLPGMPAEAQEVRFAYDPATSEVKLWVNGKLLSETKAANGPKEGKYIVLNVHDVCVLNRMDVFSGIVAPAKATGEADEKSDMVLLVNKDHYRAEKFALADGKFTIKTAFGAIEVPAEKVAAVSMSKTGRETPPQPGNAVQVSLPNTSLTVELVEMSGKTFLARSPYLGDVSIDRAAVQALRFLAPPAPPAPK